MGGAGGTGLYRALTACATCQGTALRPESLGVTNQGPHHRRVRGPADLGSPDRVRRVRAARSRGDHRGPHPQGDSRTACASCTRSASAISRSPLGRHALRRRKASAFRLADADRARISPSVLYVLDEPSIGPAPARQRKLLSTLQRLRDMGNTVWWSSTRRTPSPGRLRHRTFGPAPAISAAR